jgi:hypothetical protein
VMSTLNEYQARLFVAEKALEMGRGGTSRLQQHACRSPDQEDLAQRVCAELWQIHWFWTQADEVYRLFKAQIDNHRPDTVFFPNGVDIDLGQLRCDNEERQVIVTTGTLKSWNTQRS